MTVGLPRGSVIVSVEAAPAPRVRAYVQLAFQLAPSESARVNPEVLPSAKTPLLPPVYARVIDPPVGRVTDLIRAVTQVVVAYGVQAPEVGVEGVASYRMVYCELSGRTMLDTSGTAAADLYSLVPDIPKFVATV